RRSAASRDCARRKRTASRWAWARDHTIARRRAHLQRSKERSRLRQIPRLENSSWFLVLRSGFWFSVLGSKENPEPRTCDVAPATGDVLHCVERACHHRSLPCPRVRYTNRRSIKAAITVTIQSE